jgi:dipeptidyl aminopeptidase/acylaminoacyl peptidase
MKSIFQIFKNFSNLLIFSIFTIFLSLPIVTFSQTAKRPITSEDLWSMKRVGALTASPDGKQSAITLTTFDIKENKGTTNIWLVPHDCGQPKQLTTFKATDGSPAWSPDGKKIAFVSKREGNYAQLYVINIYGGEAEKITDMPLGVSSPEWFPDGKRIAFSANIIPELGSNLDSMKKAIEAKKKSKVTAKVSENRVIRYWDRWLTDGYYPRLFAVDSETKKITDLLPTWKNFFNLMEGADYDISPDGKEIAFSGNSTTEPYDTLNADLFIVPTDGSGKFVNLTSDNIASDMMPKYTPDGKYIIYGKQIMPDFYADRVRLIRYERSTGKKVQITIDDFDRSPSELKIAQDSKIYFSAEDRARKSIFSLPVNGGKVTEIGRMSTTALPQPLPDGRVVFLNQSTKQPNEVFIVSKDGKKISQLTKFNKELLEKISFGEIKEYYFIGADGDSVQMYVVFPPNFSAEGGTTKKWPLLQIIHGGPHSISCDDFHFRWNPQLFAAPGYVVALVNFHGSTSFGQYFAD